MTGKGGAKSDWAPISSHGESELHDAARAFALLDRQLDALVSENEWDAPEFVALHQQWIAACERMASLRASTAAGRKAKAEMLLSVLNIVSPRVDERQPHELLAASLARDLLD